jgi:polyphosphate kinase
VVGRFLEHARILQFGPDDLLTGSADLMPRNLDGRVETLVPVNDAALRAELRGMLDVLLADTTTAWRLGPGGSWTRIRPAPGDEPFSSQDHFMAQARAAATDGTAG